MSAALEQKPGTLDAVIVGAGFAGLYQLHQLRDQLGLSVVVLEAGKEVGGTWYWNRYPGARCDSESYSYCYSFDPALQQEWNWTERYPEAAEIRKYLGHVADRYDLRRDIRFNTRVKSASYDDAANLWTVRTEDGTEYRTHFFITAVGCLSSANLPKIKGIERFKGKWYHTGQWPHEGVDFTGKRVGLIGTGSTGIQAAPEIAKQAAHLTVFQRTPNYSVPARNAPLTPEFQAKVKAEAQTIRARMRTNLNGHPYLIQPESALDVPEAERQRRYEEAWKIGGLGFRGVFSDLLKNKRANDTVSDFLRAKIKEIVKDPKTAEMLTPTDHPFASKRPPVDSHYFETFNRPNVSLVDVRAAPIQEITETGVKTSEAEYPLDIIVFATGFDAMTGPLLAMDIKGSGGRSLREDWAAGPRTYLGLQMPGYPNLFTVTGPGSPTVLTNMPVAIEQHTQWITACIKSMREHGQTRIEAEPGPTEEWVAHVNEAANETLLPMANHSWYLGANVPGKPRVFMPYAGGMGRYAAKCEEVVRDGYRGFKIT